MVLLDAIHDPTDLRGLNATQLRDLAAEIRDFLITNVARTGGHLGPNLGVVELTLAIHRTFDSPRDAIVFDTGHQSYVHKILTGRAGMFPTLRQRGGLSGYPSRAESPHDWVENSHASAALSWAEGMAKGFRLRGEDRHVVAVVGDGALIGGMAWEALNNIAASPDLRLVIVVNDNGRSYTPTVGGLATQLQGLGQQLAAIRTDKRYERLLNWVKRRLRSLPLVGEPAYGLMHGLKAGVKDVLAPQGMFSDLRLKYVGPINGHDEGAVELALQQAKAFDGPVIVHCITEKGRGYSLAEADEEDHFHAIGRIDSSTGEPLQADKGRGWTRAFADELARIGASDERVVAITAAMLNPVGLGTFAKHFPRRVFDVGIAEQHAVASAAGLAATGLRPVVAVYASFLNRAFDQVLMDVALHRAPVTFVLDRAGVTGPDGASHNGMWDASVFGAVPGLRLAAPRDEERLRSALRDAVGGEGPALIRFPKGDMPDPIPAVGAGREADGGEPVGYEFVRHADSREVLIVAYGLAPLALDVAARLAASGLAASVVDPIWALPVGGDLVRLAGAHELVVTIEDNLVVGGLGAQLASALASAESTAAVRQFGIPKEFLAQGTRLEVLAAIGLSAEAVADKVLASYANLLKVSK
ncbi:MAG: 1-deoxy-D-xylulose-5-phosphate synthase [Propionibacteriaceae bacterium]|jgi:1-deoxy-D-xylulose-5-phosphate synthase|nr:1-deoxy-D-xylulose-5-phosphate synthase [Propionibacteriaceae bacterium]